MTKYYDIPVIYIYIACKKNQHILIWRYQNILVRRYWNILGLKNHTRKIYKIYKSSCIIFCIKIFWYLQIIYCQYTLKSFLSLQTRFYFLPTVSAKMGAISLLSSSGKHQSNHLVRCYAAGINCLLISFFNAFCCLDLLC